GSNTIHLVVAQPPYGDHPLKTLANQAELVRLGADVTAIGAIGPERAERAIAAVNAQLDIARSLGATTILGLATEGVRRAANASAFLQRVQAETGLTLELITGEQEAALAWWGGASAAPHLTGRKGVIDLGGGSLELILGAGTRIDWRVSLPLGSGVIRSAWLPSDPPGFREVNRAYRAVCETLATLNPPLSAPGASTGPLDVIVCGGTATVLATLASRVAHTAAAQRSAIPPAADKPVKSVKTDKTASGRQRSLTITQLDDLLTLLQHTSAQELTERYRIKEARARLLAPGAVALLAAMERLGAQRLWVSKRGIREGAILAYAHAGQGWLDAATAGAGW
ncbi:MAG: hypothetical protein ABI068_07360, partial [Ktedonobacterales bacterium]